MRECGPWAFLPPVYSAATAAGLWTVYFIAVSAGEITPLSSDYRPWEHRSLSSNHTRGARPPYISIAGDVPPASCVFSQVLNLAAFVGFIIGVLRYLQLRNHVHKPWLNTGGLVLFAFASFGMTLVGNFQFSNNKAVHNIGTFMAFVLATVFCWVQSVITIQVNLRREGRRVGIPRFLLSGAITLCMVLYLSLMAQRHHMHAARTQWALVMFLLGFVSTFAVEFRHYRFGFVCTEEHQLSLNQGETYGVSENRSDPL